MDIFIDTSVIYTDPFWKRNFANQVLESAKDKRTNIYIADVVLKETRHNFKKQVDKEINSIKNSNLTIRKLARRHKNTELPEIKGYLKDFDLFYDELFKHRNIHFLLSTKDFFEELVDRAVNKVKPFSESKSEFKDAVIWFTYYKFAKLQQLENCHLLTSNVSDFAVSSKKIELHDDLKKDYEKFSMHKTLEEFYKTHKDFIDQPIIEFTNWINSENIDRDYVFDLLFKSETQSVFDEVNRKYENVDPSSFLQDSFYSLLGGYIDVNEVAWYDCEDIEIDIVKDYAIISGVLNIDVEIDIYGYNSVRDSGDEKFPHCGSDSKSLKVCFNFTYDKNKDVENFDIIDVYE